MPTPNVFTPVLSSLVNTGSIKMAKYMGHSEKVHRNTYMRWIDKNELKAAAKRIERLSMISLKNSHNSHKAMTHYEVTQILWEAMLKVLDDAQCNDKVPPEDVRELREFLKLCHLDLKGARKSLQVKLPEFTKPR